MELDDESASVLETAAIDDETAGVDAALAHLGQVFQLRQFAFTEDR